MADPIVWSAENGPNASQPMRDVDPYRHNLVPTVANAWWPPEGAKAV
jgi:hypothetical protein